MTDGNGRNGEREAAKAKRGAEMREAADGWMDGWMGRAPDEPHYVASVFPALHISKVENSKCAKKEIVSLCAAASKDAAATWREKNPQKNSSILDSRQSRRAASVTHTHTQDPDSLGLVVSHRRPSEPVNTNAVRLMKWRICDCESSLSPAPRGSLANM